jgi:hypothetical protein
MLEGRALMAHLGVITPNAMLSAFAKGADLSEKRASLDIGPVGSFYQEARLSSGLNFPNWETSTGMLTSHLTTSNHISDCIVISV